ELRGLAQEWPGKGKRQEPKRRGAQEEQQDIVQPAPPREPRRRGGEEHQGAERDLPLGRAADQMEDDRRGDRQKAQRVERGEQAHRAPPRAGALRRPGVRCRRIRALRRSKSTISRGVSVVICSYSMPRSTHARSTSAAWAAKRRRYSARAASGSMYISR